MKSNALCDDAQPGKTYFVWDWFVRLFHWSLVICIALNWFVLTDGSVGHQWSGYVATGLVCMRIVWGFVSRGYARFSTFFPTPSRVRDHIGELIAGNHHTPTLGHNPLGSLMMLTLLGLVMLLGITGYLMESDVFFGDEWLEELHEFFANALLLAAAVHVLAAWLMGKIEKVNLVKAMITGRKTFH